MRKLVSAESRDGAKSRKLVSKFSENSSPRSTEAYLDEAVRRALPYDEQAAEWHGVERARLEKRGCPPALADGQIAAIASVNDLVVVNGEREGFSALSRSVG